MFYRLQLIFQAYLWTWIDLTNNSAIPQSYRIISSCQPTHTSLNHVWLNERVIRKLAHQLLQLSGASLSWEIGALTLFWGVKMYLGKFNFLENWLREAITSNILHYTLFFCKNNFKKHEPQIWPKLMNKLKDKLKLAILGSIWIFYEITRRLRNNFKTSWCTAHTQVMSDG